MRFRLTKGSRQNADSEDDGDVLSDATWLYSYADLITQLLLFSILTTTATGIMTRNAPIGSGQSDKAPDPALVRASEELDKFVKENNLSEDMVIDRNADRVIIRLGNVLLFDSGRAALTARAKNVLRQVITLVSHLPNSMRIEGHTDDVPLRGGAFASNWELSTARAIAVVLYLENMGIAKNRLSAAGYGEFHPIVPNQTRKQQATNRRVEVILVAQ